MRRPGCCEIVQGGREIGEALADDPQVPLRLGDRLDADGPGARARGSRRGSGGPCSSSAATMR